MTEIDQGAIDYKHELVRKSVHLCSLSMPIIYYYVTRELALIVLVPLLLFILFFDISRHYIIPIKTFYNNLFGFMLRKHETDENKKNLNGASYVLLSAVIVVFIFPKVIVITSFAVLIIGDIFAALIGRKFGRHSFLKKSLEGTLAFFFTAAIVVIVAPKVEYTFGEYIIGFVAVAVGAIVENLSGGWADDNLTIPLSIGLVMWGLYIIFIPEMALILTGVPN
ncbi:MAG: SEC59/DGK1/VTE5 family protein [Bacteroidetes bacterium]|nr:SEC59/DGK1/VTE5 family protein [Bacteroidota bacterium]